MKIAIWHNLPSGGGKRGLYNFVSGLIQRGHTVEAWCPPTAERSFLPLQDLIPEHEVSLSHVIKPETGAVSKYIHVYTNVTENLKAMDRHCKECALQMNGNAIRYVQTENILLLVRATRRQYYGYPDAHRPRIVR